MELLYVSNKLKKNLTEPVKVSKTYGAIARKVIQRIKELTSCESLEDMKALPAARCHQLSGVNKGQLAVDISKNYRLIFEPNHDPMPQKDKGGLDWSKVTSILICDLTDYH